MLFYIAYIFIALATTVAIYKKDDSNPTCELIVSVITGASWPLLFTVRIIRKILN